MSAAAGKSEWSRRVLPVFIGVVVLAAVLGTLALVMIPAPGMRFEYVIVSLLSTGLFSLTSIACALNWARGSWRPAALIGLILSVLSLPLFLAAIWNKIPWGYERRVEDAMVLGATGSVLMPLLGLLALARLHKRWVWARTGTQILAMATALFITWLIFANPRGDDWLRLLGVLLILTSCGTICVAVLHWARALRTQGNIITTPLLLTLVCPRCRESQEMAAGPSQCKNCGLRIRIEIEEEHCQKCGYALYKLTSARCPECGAPVAESLDRAEGA